MVNRYLTRAGGGPPGSQSHGGMVHVGISGVVSPEGALGLISELNGQDDIVAEDEPSSSTRNASPRSCVALVILIGDLDRALTFPRALSSVLTEPSSLLCIFMEH